MRQQRPYDPIDVKFKIRQQCPFSWSGCWLHEHVCSENALICIFILCPFSVHASYCQYRFTDKQSPIRNAAPLEWWRMSCCTAWCGDSLICWPGTDPLVMSQQLSRKNGRAGGHNWTIAGNLSLISGWHTHIIISFSCVFRQVTTLLNTKLRLHKYTYLLF